MNFCSFPRFFLLCSVINPGKLFKISLRLLGFYLVRLFWLSKCFGDFLFSIKVQEQSIFPFEGIRLHSHFFEFEIFAWFDGKKEKIWIWSVILWWIIAAFGPGSYFEKSILKKIGKKVQFLWLSEFWISDFDQTLRFLWNFLCKSEISNKISAIFNKIFEIFNEIFELFNKILEILNKAAK